MKCCFAGPGSLSGKAEPDATDPGPAQQYYVLQRIRDDGEGKAPSRALKQRQRPDDKNDREQRARKIGAGSADLFQGIRLVHASAG